MRNSRENLRYATKEECILVFLASGRKTPIGKGIQEAYKAWQQTPDSCRWDMDMEMHKSLEHSHKQLYETLINGFQIWDRTQNTAGAPGWCITDSSINDVMKHIGAQLLGLLHAMEEIWKRFSKDEVPSQASGSPSECQLARPSASLLSVVEQGPVTQSDKLQKEDSRCEVTGDRRGGRNEELSVTDLTKLAGMFCSDIEEDELPIVEKECQDSEEMLASSALCDKTDISYERMEEGLERPDATSTFDMIMEEAVHLNNLLIDDHQEDSDVDKQISPLFSEEEME